MSHYVGVHVSAAKGIHNIFKNAIELNCKSIACFVKSQKKWISSPLSDDEIVKFQIESKKYSFDLSKIVVHGSYLINLASGDENIREKSINCIIDEVTRCKKLGITLYVIHPGSTLGKININQGVQLVVEALDQIIEKTADVMILIETMVSQV